jgi:hypothetical protein
MAPVQPSGAANAASRARNDDWRGTIALLSPSIDVYEAGEVSLSALIVFPSPRGDVCNARTGDRGASGGVRGASDGVCDPLGVFPCVRNDVTSLRGDDCDARNRIGVDEGVDRGAEIDLIAIERNQRPPPTYPW